MDTEARTKLWRSQISEFLAQFASDNRDAYSVEDRWLAAKVKEWRDVVQMAGWSESNVHRAAVTAAINAFRLAEIEKERAALQARDAEFEKEAARLSGKVAPRWPKAS